MTEKYFKEKGNTAICTKNVATNEPGNKKNCSIV